MLDLDNLMEEFNIPQSAVTDTEVIDIPPPDLSLKPTDISEPDKIISDTVSKASAILDHLMKVISSGDYAPQFLPRMVEVASGILAVINDSTSQLYNKHFETANIRLKIQALQLKERQLGILENTGGMGNKNIIFTDRESILRLLKDEEPKQIGLQNSDNNIS